MGTKCGATVFFSFPDSALFPASYNMLIVEMPTLLCYHSGYVQNVGKNI